VSTVFPFVVASPAYFAGAVQLGGLMQTSSAFGSVQSALSFFINTYRGLAEWRAVIERLDGFDRSWRPRAHRCDAAGHRRGAEQDARHRLQGSGGAAAEGAPLVTATGVTIALGDKVLVSGPSGSGKSTLFRALAGSGRSAPAPSWCRRMPK